MTESIRLIGDIGGTNARFALANTDQPGYRDELALTCADFPDVEEAIRHYLAEAGVSTPSSICLAIAGPVVDQQVKLTNNPWFISAQKLAHTFGSPQIRIINDFTAIALCLPLLGSSDIEEIGPSIPNEIDPEASNMAVLGPGTGLGIAGLLQRHGSAIPITSEAGHMGFAAETPLQIEILETLRQRWPRVSIERLISGSGLENTFWALSHLNGEEETSPGAAAIFKQAMADDHSTAYKAVEVFFEVLGQVAGDIAMAYGASDGVFIAGGMVKRYPALLQNSRFRGAFMNKGRHQALLESIPTYLITHPQPGLLGASGFSFD